MCAAMPLYREEALKDRQFIIDLADGAMRTAIKVTAQHEFNSHPEEADRRCTDFRGNPGCWEPGHFMVHTRGDDVLVMREYMDKVIH